jgi:hypothetical protein
MFWTRSNTTRFHVSELQSTSVIFPHRLLKVATLSDSRPIPRVTEWTKVWNGRTLCIATDRALYSASIVERAISDWSLLVQMTGQFERQITKPVRLLTQVGSNLSSYGQSPAKSALQKTSMSRTPVGRRIRHWSIVNFKYWPILSRATSWDRRGEWENRAHWLTAKVMSGREWPYKYCSMPITLA